MTLTWTRGHAKTPSVCRCGVTFYPFLKPRKYPPTCSMVCRNRAISERQRGNPPPPRVLDGLRRKYQQRVEAVTIEFFGRLSKREIEIFTYAVALGRKRGRDQRAFLRRKAAA